MGYRLAEEPREHHPRAAMSFPATLHIHLPEFQRRSLDFLREHHPDDCTDEELVRLVLAHGILAMMEAELAPTSVYPEEVASSMQDPSERVRELRSRETESAGKSSMKRSRAFPSRMNMMIDLKGKEDWADLHARDAEYDRESARMKRDLGLTEDGDGDVHAMPHRHVEQTLWVLMPEVMRRSFEDFLDAHPDLDENEALRILLGRVLDQERQAKQTPREKKATEMLRLAERLYARSKRRCG